MAVLTRKPLSLAEKSALIALGGIMASVMVWFGHAYVEGGLLGGMSFTEAVVHPTAAATWSRLIAIVSILLGTITTQAVYTGKEQLRDSEERYRGMIDSSPDIVLVGCSEQLTFLNVAGMAVLGLQDQEQVIGLPLAELFDPHSSDGDRRLLDHALSTGSFDRPIQARLRRPDNTHLDVELTGAPLQLAGRPAIQYVARDITERLNAEETIRHMAYYDSLTGLPNRALFHDRLNVALEQAKRARTQFAVIYLDINNFKTINDTYGYSAGDRVLRAIGTRLQGALRREDAVARLSADEFTVIARLGVVDEVHTLAVRLLNAVDGPMAIDGHEIHVTTNLGIAQFPENGQIQEELIRNADTALRYAKEMGRSGYRVFSPDMKAEARDQLELEAQLRQALANHEFELRYQPQVNSSTGRVVGLEALLRWHHPQHGELAPDSFLGVAEQSWLISAIGSWALDSACRQAREWHEAGLEFGHIAVNLSAREFRQSGLVDMVAETLKTSGLAANMLELEITESTALEGIDSVLETLGQLRALGIRLAIDDFGTGYSSLSYLRRFPIQTLKIAQTFMNDVHQHPHSAGIAAMMIDLCRLLDLDVVAEGVEHPEQLEFLTRQGCYVVQGYIFSKPLWAQEVNEFLLRGAIAPVA